MKFKKYISVFYLLATALLISCATSPKQSSSLKHFRNQCSAEMTYPFSSVSRYYRYEMIQNLLSFKSKNETTYLKKYSYWFKKWKKNFPSEYEQDCEKFHSKKLQRIEKFDLPDPLLPSLLEAYAQSYESHILAKLSMEVLKNQKVKGWMLKMDQGKSPMDILARHYKTEPSDTNLDIQGQFFKASIKAMDELQEGTDLDGLMRNLANTQRPHLVLKMEPAPEGSEIKRRFLMDFNFPDLQNVKAIRLHKNRRLRHKDQTLLDSPWIISGEETPCSKNRVQVYSIENNEEGKLLIQILEEKLKIKPKTKTGIWYCLNHHQQTESTQ